MHNHEGLVYSLKIKTSKITNSPSIKLNINDIAGPHLKIVLPALNPIAPYII
jgi:hypothetical protein